LPVSQSSPDAKPESDSRQTSEFERFAQAVKTIMAVPKDAIDPHKPIRPRNGAGRQKRKPKA
jgi:hypothetical protein